MKQPKIIYTAPLKTGYHDNATWLKLNVADRGCWLGPGTKVALVPPEKSESWTEDLAKDLAKPPGPWVNCPQPTGKRYSYLVIDANVCHACMGPREPDSYVSEDPQTILLRRAIKEGYRWTRTDYTGNGTGQAIWEKEWSL